MGGRHVAKHTQTLSFGSTAVLTASPLHHPAQISIPAWVCLHELVQKLAWRVRVTPRCRQLRGACHFQDPAAAPAHRTGQLHLRLRTAHVRPATTGPPPCSPWSDGSERCGRAEHGAEHGAEGGAEYGAEHGAEGCGRSWDPASKDQRIRVNFKFGDGSWQRAAFEYDWRLWGLEDITAVAVKAVRHPGLKLNIPP